MHTPEQAYLRRLEELKKEKLLYRKKGNIISVFRLVSLISGFLAAYYLFPMSVGAAIIGFCTFFAVFLRLVVIAVNNSRRIQHIDRQIAINEDELKLLKHKFVHRKDGSNLMPALHDYAEDLDILGRASLFQYIHRTTSEQGDRLLASWMLNPAEKDEILLRQDAVKELAPKMVWRQELQSYGAKDLIRSATEERLLTWNQETHPFFESLQWNWIRIAGPVIMLSALALHIGGVLSAPYFYLLVFVFFLLSGYISKKVFPIYSTLNKMSAEMEALSDSIEWIEKGKFTSVFLVQHHQSISDKEKKASLAIREFKKILEKMDLRLNPLVFIPLNTFLLWDLQQLLALKKWKEEHSGDISLWFRTIAVFESISSLAALHFNQPNWTFPDISDQHGNFESKGIGHPLITSEKRVCSDFSSNHVPGISLITGSNMAGKSTFLRTVGVNMVLAIAGAPVCAAFMRLTPMRIISSMRIADNLEESTSTFYAELKKLKRIIIAVDNHDKVFLLMDEILRGTNSRDRHVGSKALIRQLVREKACGIMATHDLELATLAEEFPDAIRNYHFDVQVEGEELYFDYKLKNGICQSLNASILMKKIGIEV
ncbi:MAG TPA: hypothetical protein VIK74_08290 [Parasegetibacter sp.]